MNKKFVQKCEDFFKCLDNHIFKVIGISILLWVYYLAGIFGIAVFFTLLIITWIVGRILFGKESEIGQHSKQESFDLPYLKDEKSEELIQEEEALMRKEIKTEKTENLTQFAKNKFELSFVKALFKIITYILLLAFFIGIFLYNNGIIEENNLRIIGVISAVFYLFLFLSGIEKDSTVNAELRKWKKNKIIRKILGVFTHFLSYISEINIYLFPFIVLGVFAFMVLAGYGVIPSIRAQSLLLLYIISIGLLIINAYTVKVQKGFLILATKIGAIFKTFLYIFVPAFLVWMLFVGKDVIAVSDYVLALFLITGSFFLIYLDPIYRKISVPTMQESGKAFAGSYFKYLIRYGLVIVILIGTYYGALYFREHNIGDLFQPENQITETPFMDLELNSWAFEPIYYLYENEVLSLDADNFIHPAKVLEAPEALTILFKYFDIRIEDFDDEPDISLRYVPYWDENYDLFKTAYHLDLVGEFIEPEQIVNKDFALNVISKLDSWKYETDDEYRKMAFDKKIINSIDPVDLSQPLNRATLAQILFNLYNYKKHTFEL